MDNLIIRNKYMPQTSASICSSAAGQSQINIIETCRVGFIEGCCEIL